MNAPQDSKAEIIDKLLSAAELDKNPISISKARKYAERILRGETPAEIANRPHTFRHITWTDPTGEEAVRNVLEEQNIRKAA